MTVVAGATGCSSAVWFVGTLVVVVLVAADIVLVAA